MTYREKLAQEHPNCVTEEAAGGCESCPHTYGYELESPCSKMGDCRACWDREMPMTPEEQEQHDLKINAEIIRGYCDQYKTKPCNQCPAHDPCFEMPGNAFAASANKYNPEKQRSMLDAFEAALPPEEDMTYPVRRRIPESVRDLIDSRIYPSTIRSSFCKPSVKSWSIFGTGRRWKNEAVIRTERQSKGIR